MLNPNESQAEVMGAAHARAAAQEVAALAESRASQAETDRLGGMAHAKTDSQG